MSIKTLVRAGLALTAAGILLAGCAAAPGAPVKTATRGSCARMVTDSGGLDDRSFNDASWKGLQDAQAKYGIDAKVLVSTSETDLAPNVQHAVDSGCTFVLTVGYSLADATLDQATKNPHVNFSIVDDVVTAPNVKPIVFDTAQASYLAGYLAAGVTKTGIVATFGGGNQPPVTLFMDGFVDGVAKYNAVHSTKVSVLGWNKATQDGVFTGDFEDVNKGLTTAQGFIDQGADVILPVAGQVGEGAARAALDSRKASIVWVDSDGYNTLPKEFRPVLLTSVLKNTGDAVVQLVGQSLDGSFNNKQFVGTLTNGGVGIAPFHDLAGKVSASLAAEIETLRQSIISGALVVTSPNTPK